MLDEKGVTLPTFQLSYFSVARCGQCPYFELVKAFIGKLHIDKNVIEFEKNMLTTHQNGRNIPSIFFYYQ